MYTFLLIAIYGLIIGSFLNVCIYRLPLGESIVYKPSHCMNCNHRLGIWDLFPVFSFLALKGRCRYCGTKVSSQYPIIESVNMLLYLVVYFVLGLNLISVLTMGLVSSLIVVFMVDIKHQIIPDGVNIFIGVLGVGVIILDYQHWLIHIIGMLLVSSLFLLIAFLTKGQMGGGDIKLMAAAGLFLGWDKILMAMVIGAFVGAIISIGLMGKKKAQLRTQIPFGPFLAIGIFCMSLYGDELIKLYINLVLK